MSNLVDKFQKYVGETIKYPHRVTTDQCDVAVDIQNDAIQDNLMVIFTEVGASDTTSDPSHMPLPRINQAPLGNVLECVYSKTDDGSNKYVIDSFRMN